MWWEVHTADDARHAAEHVAEYLTSSWWATARRLLDRDIFLTTVRSGDLGMFQAGATPGLFARVEAALLTDAGPGPDLEACLGAVVETAGPADRATTDQFVAWARRRARSRSPRT